MPAPARLFVAVAIAGAMAFLGPPGKADTGGGSASGWGNETGGGVTVGVPEQRQNVGGGGGGEGGPRCSYSPWISDSVEVQPVPPTGVGYYAIRDCDGQIDVVFVPNAPAPAVSAVDLAQQAANELTVSECTVAVAPPSDRLIVRLPTWLWLEGCAWAPLSATASVPLLSATVTAAPTGVVWDLGEGTRLACAGPGVAWRADVPAEVQSTYCSHAYARSSAGQPGDAYTVTATVRWELSWSASNGEGGGLSPVLPSSSATVRVGEVQAIVER